MSEPSVSTERPALRRLAARLGIAESYLDQTGDEQRITTDATRERLLAAMGIDASTEERALEALRSLHRAARRRLVAPVRVVRERSRTLRRVRATSSCRWCRRSATTISRSSSMRRSGAGARPSG